MSLATETAPRYDLSSPRFFSDPESTFGVMRERDPVYFDPGLSAWVLTSYEDVCAALRNPNLSVDRNGEIGRASSSKQLTSQLNDLNDFVSCWMVFSDPPRHTRLRGLVARAFHPQAVNALRGAIDQTVDELLDAARRRGTLDVLVDLGVPLSERITTRLLGLPADSPRQLKEWTERLFQFLGAARASDEVVRTSADGMRECRTFIASLLEARRRAPEDDLISQIVHNGDGEIAEEEAIGLVITLIAGSYETTAHTIANGLYALVRNPLQLGLLRDDPTLLESAVEEIFRFEGPALSVQRRAKHDLSIRNTPIRALDRVYCMLHAANHDSAAFANPSELDVTRSPCRHVGLGLGPHFCLGAWLTRVETQRAIGETVRRFPDLRLAPGPAPEWAANFAMRGLKELSLSV